ncbi:peptidoglycan bridge formation glycyltransferase FemA/FemB family protein [Actinomycetaceae bacterium L2_0104]
MEFKQLSDHDYRTFVSGQERCFYTQLPEYGDVRESEGFSVERVGLLQEGTIRGVATIVYQPWKKFFRRAVVPYGPVLDWQDEDLVLSFFEELRGWVAKDKRVLALRVNPLVERRSYSDITPGSTNDEARTFERAMEMLEAERLEKEFYDSSDVQVRFAYVKDLDGMDYQAAVASCHQMVRTAFRKAGTNGVEIKFLGPEDFDVLEKVLAHTADRTDMEEVSQAAASYYRELMNRMGPEGMLMPVAILNCPQALQLIADERQEVESKTATLETAERSAQAEGRQLGKKQRNQLKEARSRLEVLDRREKETLQIRGEHGDEIVLAASLFVHSPHELVYLLSGSYAQFQSYNGIYLIHRAMFEWAFEHDVRWYNMFGITGDFSNEASDAGVLHFKRQFNGNVEEYVGTYDVPLRKRLAPALNAVG